MSDQSAIEWTRGDDGAAGATWNPIRARNLTTGKVGSHCEKVSPGCAHCYAERINLRLGTQRPYAGIVRIDPSKATHKPAANVEVYLDEKVLVAPLRWKKPRRIFVCSMTDLFGEWLPDEWVDCIFAAMALCPQHTFQILTKRPERMLDYVSGIKARKRGYWHEEVGLLCASIKTGGDDDGLPEPYESAWTKMRNYYFPECVPAKTLGDSSCSCPWPIPNVWLGVSVEDQATAHERIPLLLKTPAAVRFVSYEPALGAVDFTSIADDGHSAINCLTGNQLVADQVRHGAALDWLIVGGESGPKSRACDVAWIRSAVQQCKAAGVPCFVKQLGSRPICPIGGCAIDCECGLHHGFKDPKGGGPAEWPEDLRVREFPR